MFTTTTTHNPTTHTKVKVIPFTTGQVYTCTVHHCTTPKGVPYLYKVTVHRVNGVPVTGTYKKWLTTYFKGYFTTRQWLWVNQPTGWYR